VQAHDSDLDAIAALTTTAYGRAFLALANQAALTALLPLDTDTTLAANSDAKIATQKATKAYADALIAANDAMVFKGVIDCSTNPNYPAADRGHTYRVSVAGKIGGASGTNVEVGDLLICLTDGTAAGTQAAVGSAWTITQTNIDGAVTLTGTQTLTNKTLTSPLGIVKADVGLGNVDNTSNTTERAAAATLTNKDVSSATNTFPTNLAQLIALSLVADRLPYANGTGTLALTTLTSFIRTLLDDTTASAARTTLGVDCYVSGLATTGTVTIDAANGEGVYASATLTGNITLAVSNVPTVFMCEYQTTQHASAAKTITLPSGSTPFPTTFNTPAVGKKVRMWLSTIDGGTTWDVYQMVTT
jgi:hypothetical protein